MKIKLHYHERLKIEYAHFFCPACNEEHKLIIHNNTAPYSIGEMAWDFNRNLDKPTITPSIKVTYDTTGGDRQYIKPQFIIGLNICHSFITDGKIQYLSDCTHSLAGHTIDLPEIK